MSYLAEPAFWIILAPVLIGLIETAGVAFARPYYRHINAAYDAYVTAHPDDHEWASKTLNPFVNQGLIWIIFLFAPVLAGALIFFGARQVFTGKTPPSAPVSEPSSPPRAAFTQEITNLAVPAMMWHAPFRTAWLFFWLILGVVVSSPVLLLRSLRGLPVPQIADMAISLFREGVYGFHHLR